MYFIAEGERTSYVPNELDYTKRVKFEQSGLDDKSFDIELDDYKSNRWLIGIYNTDPSQQTIVSIKPSTSSSEEKSVLMYVLIALAIMIVVMWIILGIVKSKLSRSHRRVA